MDTQANEGSPLCVLVCHPCLLCGHQISNQTWNEHTIPGIFIDLLHRYNLLHLYHAGPRHSCPSRGTPNHLMASNIHTAKDRSSLDSIAWRGRGNMSKLEVISLIWWRPPFKKCYSYSSAWSRVSPEIPKLWPFFPHSGNWWWQRFSWRSPFLSR